ncbi:MAG: nuclear transport factor 2 family protein [Proteobacteria bacterium]|uniref:nuclear transport factor 2 family protein n=1 Tax=Aquabacterium sp. TaxID=1872578 RepID=UPI0035C6C0EB|nr:nuclear transport factor 2 family protein [Pseudomonadota bacterium]
MTPDPRLARIVHAYETLSEDTVQALVDLYAADATFKDPFNDVSGRDAIARIFRHMFSAVDQPRFQVREAIAQGEQAFLTWDFHCRGSVSGQVLCIHGATHLRFGADGRVIRHRDYWDAAEELYAKQPLLGGLMRWLQRRLRAPA